MDGCRLVSRSLLQRACIRRPVLIHTNPRSCHSAMKKKHVAMAASITDASQSTLDGQLLVGCGGACMDYLATVSSYPNPDDKIRSTALEMQGGGNVGNALTGAARLGLPTRVLTKVADDAMGRGIISELQAEGIDTSHIIVGHGGNSPFTYIIVDQQTSTRTCIHTPGHPPLLQSELSPDARSAFLSGATMAYFDARLPQVAVPICHQAVSMGLPVLVDAEKPREGLDDLLACADYVVTAQGFTETWTGVPSLGPSLLAAAARLPHAVFIIITLGAAGCAMLDRREVTAVDGPSVDIDSQLSRLRAQLQEKEKEGRAATETEAAVGGAESNLPSVISSEPLLLSSPIASEDGQVITIPAKLVLATAKKLRPEQVVDTTGAGDAFIAAILTGLALKLPTEQMLQLAATVAAAKCQALGARTGLPRRSDPQLAALLQSGVVMVP